MVSAYACAAVSARLVFVVGMLISWTDGTCCAAYLDTAFHCATESRNGVTATNVLLQSLQTHFAECMLLEPRGGSHSASCDRRQNAADAKAAIITVVWDLQIVYGSTRLFTEPRSTVELRA